MTKTGVIWTVEDLEILQKAVDEKQITVNEAIRAIQNHVVVGKIEEILGGIEKK